MDTAKVLVFSNAALNVPLIFTTTVSNVLILAAIWKTTTLHTVTNALVFSLALSDLGVGLICQPLGILISLSLVEHEKTWASVFQMFTASLSAISLLTITAISMERYMALKLHLRYQELVTIKRVVCALVSIWASSIAAASAFMWDDTALFYKMAFPVILVCLVINIFIYQNLYRACRLHHARIRDQTVLQDEQFHQRTIAEARFRKSVKTMFLILFALIMCYLPFCCYTLIMVVIACDFNYINKRHGCEMLFTTYTYTWTVIFANSTVNPALLYFQLSELRLAVKGRLRKFCGCRKNRNENNSVRPWNVKDQISLRPTFRFTNR